MAIYIKGTARLGLPNGSVFHVEPEELEYLGDTGSGRQMGPEMIHNYGVTDENGDGFIWEVSEYPLGVLNHINHQKGKYTIITDFDFYILHEPETEEEYEYAIEQMVRWFRSNFQDPVNRLSYNGREGGYSYLHGRSYDAREEIADQFDRLFSEALIEKAVERVEADGAVNWDNTKDFYDEIEPSNPESNDQFTKNIEVNPLEYFPTQERGFNWELENGKAVYKPALINPVSITARLHSSLVNATEQLRNTQRTIGNKYNSLLAAIDAYFNSINKELALIDAVEVYALGLDLDTEYKEALAYSGDSLGQYPELNRDEKSSIQKVLRRHAAYIQSTPEGASLTDAEERHLRTFQQEKQFVSDVKAAASIMLERPDIIDKQAAQLIHDYSDPAPNDPNASRKKTLSRVGLRNFLIVAGIGTAISAGTGAIIGLAVSSVAGSSFGLATGGFVGAGVGWVSKRTIQETKAFKQFTEISSQRIDDWLELERPKLKSLAEFFRDSWDVFKPTVDSPGIDEWFEHIHETSISKVPEWAQPDFYVEGINQLGLKVDVKALAGMISYLGPSLENRDTSVVACSDEIERQNIAKGYGQIKLELSEDVALNLVALICNAMKSVRFKRRVTFYYLMAEKVNQLEKFYNT